jgi:hypothetical protein
MQTAGGQVGPHDVGDALRDIRNVRPGGVKGERLLE